MADLIVDTYRLKQYAQRIADVRSRISRLDGRIDSLYYRTGLKGLHELMRRNDLASYSNRLKQCRSYMEETANAFTELEKTLSQCDPTNFTPPVVGTAWFDSAKARADLRKILLQVLGGPAIIGTGPSMTGVAEPVISAFSAFWAGELILTDSGYVWGKSSDDGETYGAVLRGEYTVSATPEYGVYKDKKILGDEDHFDVNKSQESKPIKQINPDENWYDDSVTILEAKAEARVEGSVLDGRVAGSNDWAEGSLEGKLLTAEAYAEAKLGLYVYEKDKNGNVKKIFSPGVSAEVGASAAVAEVTADGRIGLGENKNMLGVYGEAEAEVLAAEAKAKIAANRNEIYAGASAEADLAKVSGTAGVSVLGTDVGVSGSLKIGAGAHAEIGYTDGKLKVDVGAAVGVGFDLGMEVDVGGTVDAVCDLGESVWEGATEIGGNIAKGAAKAGEAVLDGAEKVGKNIQKGAAKLGESVWEGASDAYNWIFK